MTAKPRGATWRLAPYFLVLALPLAFGVWTFGSYAADSARNRIDARLEATLAQAGATFRGTVTQAAEEARSLARTPRVQRALARRDRRTLVRLARAGGAVSFYAGGRRLAGAIPRDAPRRSILVVRHRRALGAVVVGVPLDERLLTRLSVISSLPHGYRLVLLERDRVTAGIGRGSKVRAAGARVPELSLAGRRYRAAAARLVSGRDVRLAAIVPTARVSAVEWHARSRVLLAGLAILLGVGLAAYSLAVAFSRIRVARQQRAQATQILSHVGDGVFLVDPGGTIGFWNAAAEAITGARSFEVLGRAPAAVFRRWSESAPEASSRGPDGAATGLYEVGGKELWLSMSAVDSPVGVVYAFRDLTEQLRFEETRSDFVATVSHELRTPLASIHGAASTLRQRADHLTDTTRRQLLEIVSEQSERLTQLVDQILLANQLASGTVVVDRQSFDAGLVAQSIVESIRPSLPPRTTLELRTSGLHRVVGDPEKTRRVLVNLVENAVKYSPRGGLIELGIDERAGHVRFWVRDHGLGIATEDQERIFEKFYRLDPAMRGGIGGSGLGLFICRELVALMNGRIMVDSTPGLGSTFTVELPSAPLGL